MARINIEADLFTRIEWTDLVVHFKDRGKALGELNWAWIIAQKYWLDKENPRQLIPLEVWERERLSEALITFGFAERRSDGVYMRGSDEQFQWWFEGIDQRREAGKRSAAVRAEKYGTSIPQNATNTPNENRTGVRTEPNATEPSSSSSCIKNLNTYTDFQESDPEPPPEPEPDDPLPTRSDFEALYKRLYPRKEGKKRGIDICMAKYRTWEHLANLETAIAKYVAHCKKKNQFLKHFDSFMGEWTDCLDEDFGTESLKVVKVTNAAPDPFDHEINLIYQARRQFNSWQETEARVWLGVSAELVDRLGGWTEVQMLSDDTASRNKIIQAIKATQEVLNATGG